MKSISKELKKILIFTLVTVVASLAYFMHARSLYPPTPERETFLSELGEGIGEIGLWLLIFIYARTALKLLLGKGAISRRLLPEYDSPINASYFQ